MNSVNNETSPRHDSDTFDFKPSAETLLAAWLVQVLTHCTSGARESVAKIKELAASFPSNESSSSQEGEKVLNKLNEVSHKDFDETLAHQLENLAQAALTSIGYSYASRHSPKLPPDSPWAEPSPQPFKFPDQK